MYIRRIYANAKASFLLDLGGMDEDYFLHVEDIDFCLRVEKINGSILYLPHVSVIHRKGSSDSFPGSGMA